MAQGRQLGIRGLLWISKLKVELPRAAAKPYDGQ